MSQVTYTIQVIHSDRDDWVAALSSAVSEELKELGLHRSVEVDVTRELPPEENPSVGAYLGSKSAKQDPELAELIRNALGGGRVVIPVVEDLSTFSKVVPDRLREVNGLDWEIGPRRVARRLLEELGIEDKQRSVFISHKREDGLWAAEQVFDALAHAGFTPFIDRFNIRPGARVQDTIADVLEQYAFLLLLETPKAHESEWVFDEVDYALSHTMGTLIVEWPDDPTPVPGSHGLARHRLTSKDVISTAHGDELTGSALDNLIEEVERAHAVGLTRRRRMLVRSVEEAARAADCDSCVNLPGWRLSIQRGKKSTLVGVTPRLPTPLDLHLLDMARGGDASEPEAVLVHSARVLRSELRDLLAWAVGDRDLELVPENAVGGQW